MTSYSSAKKIKDLANREAIKLNRLASINGRRPLTKQHRALLLLVVASEMKLTALQFYIDPIGEELFSSAEPLLQFQDREIRPIQCATGSQSLCKPTIFSDHYLTPAEINKAWKVILKAVHI